ncbi:MAG TPA: hypothetical protein VI685_06825 [Candidatus Angelobacter sp.]
MGDLYQDFEFAFFSRIKNYTSQPVFFQTVQLSNEFKIPDEHICEMLLDWAAARLIWLAAWDNEQHRARPWDEWPDKNDVFKQRLDSYNVRIKILTRGSQHLARLLETKKKPIGFTEK